jgi:hypothetical protein
MRRAAGAAPRAGGLGAGSMAAKRVTKVAQVTRTTRAALAALLSALGCVGPAAAASLDACHRANELRAGQQDRLLRAAALLRDELERSGAGVAVIARSGLNLRWFGVRYSHAGVALRDGRDSPWSVRQLYYACEDERPRLFDEGLAAFLFATEDPDHGFVSALLLPRQAEAALLALAQDDGRALALQRGTYAANAHPYSLRFQNCNQWLVELLALSWSGTADAGPDPRATAQRWLREQHYQGSVFALGWSFLTRLTAFTPHLTRADHPPEDLAQGLFRVSMPASIEALVLERHPATQRIELCHTRERLVLRHGPEPLPPDCTPAPGDRVVRLD